MLEFFIFRTFFRQIYKKIYVVFVELYLYFFKKR